MKDQGLVHSPETRLIPTCAVVLIAALLAGCVPDSSRPPLARDREPDPVVATPEAPEPEGVNWYRHSPNVNKVCDEGRAVYWTGYERGGVAVVENAPECARLAAPLDERATGDEGRKADGVNP